MFKSWLPITKIKIFGASILYKVTHLFFRKNKQIITRNGIKYELDLTEGMELSLFLFGNFQSHITKNSLLKIDEKYIILDVGANVGIMTLPFAKQASQGQVYAFEPTHYAFLKLKRNVELNPDMAKRIKFYNVFISEYSEEHADIIAYSSWKVNGHRSDSDHPVHLGTPMDTTGISSISINDFVENNSISNINFIKIDTDGHELEVLKGGLKVIEKFRPIIIFEIGLYVMEEKNIIFDTYYELFKSMNYKLYDTKTNVKINLNNYKKYIPKNGSTDLIAIP